MPIIAPALPPPPVNLLCLGGFQTCPPYVPETPPPISICNLDFRKKTSCYATAASTSLPVPPPSSLIAISNEAPALEK